MATGDDDDFLSFVFGLYHDLTGRAPGEPDRTSAEKLRGVALEVIRRVMPEVARRAPKPIHSLEYFVEEVVRGNSGCSHVSAADEPVARAKAPNPTPPSPGAVVAAQSLAPTRSATFSALGLGVAPAPVEISADDKHRVFARVAAFLPTFSAAYGRSPTRDELRAHLHEFCLDVELDVGLVEEMYPATTARPKGLASDSRRACDGPLPYSSPRIGAGP